MFVQIYIKNHKKQVVDGVDGRFVNKIAKLFITPIFLRVSPYSGRMAN